MLPDHVKEDYEKNLILNQVRFQLYLDKKKKDLEPIVKEYGSRISEIIKSFGKISTRKQASNLLQKIDKEIAVIYELLSDNLEHRIEDVIEESNSNELLLLLLLGIKGKKSSSISKNPLLQLNKNTALTKNQWLINSRTAEKIRIANALNTSLLNGYDQYQTSEIVSGKNPKKEVGGRISRTLTIAAVILGTTLQSISSDTRESIYNNSGALYLTWSSILDSRTTNICRSRDGKIIVLKKGYKIGNLLDPQSARPPAHANCRSILKPSFDGSGSIIKDFNQFLGKLSEKEKRIVKRYNK